MPKKKKKKTAKKIGSAKKKSAAPKKKKARAGKTKAAKGISIAYLGLGSNVGDREEYVEQACFLLEKNPAIEILRRSTNAETEPEGGTASSQPAFINAAVKIKTKLSPHELLDACNEIEIALGRERDVEWGPRTIDIDILLYNDEIISDEKLQIPHPLMHERFFVLKPLREIADEEIHPVLEKTIEALYEEKKSEMGDRYDDDLPGFKEIKGATYDDYERW